VITLKEVAEARNNWQKNQKKYILDVKSTISGITPKQPNFLFNKEPPKKPELPKTQSEAIIQPKQVKIYVPVLTPRARNAERIETLYTQVHNAQRGNKPVAFRIISEKRDPVDDDLFVPKPELGLQELMSNKLYVRCRSAKKYNSKPLNLKKNPSVYIEPDKNRAGEIEMRRTVTEAAEKPGYHYDGAEHIHIFREKLLKKYVEDSTPHSPIQDSSLNYIPGGRKTFVNLKSFCSPREVSTPTSPSSTLNLKKMSFSGHPTRPATSNHSTNMSSHSALKFKTSVSDKPVELSVFSRPITSQKNRHVSVLEKPKEIDSSLRIKTADKKYRIHGFKSLEVETNEDFGPNSTQETFQSASSPLGNDILTIKSLDKKRLKIKMISNANANKTLKLNTKKT